MIETFYTDCGSDIEGKTWNKILFYDRNILYRLWQWYRGKKHEIKYYSMIETFYTYCGSDIEEKHEIKYYFMIETFYTDCGSDIEGKNMK